MGQTVGLQLCLRSLAIINEGCTECQAGLGVALPTSRLLDPKIAELAQLGALVAIGAPAVCLEWSTARALAADATEDEITGVKFVLGQTIRYRELTFSTLKLPSGA